MYTRYLSPLNTNKVDIVYTAYIDNPTYNIKGDINPKNRQKKEFEINENRSTTQKRV